MYIHISQVQMMLPFITVINIITLGFPNSLFFGLEDNMVFATVMELDEACNWDFEMVGYLLTYRIQILIFSKPAHPLSVGNEQPKT